MIARTRLGSVFTEWSLRRGAAVVFLIASLAASNAAGAQALAERKIEGTVLRVTVTLCELRPRGCAGYMILDAKRRDRREQVLVQVRLGVPIRHEERYIALALLARSRVSVVYVTEKGGIVARSVKVLFMPKPAPGHG